MKSLQLVLCGITVAVQTHTNMCLSLPSVKCRICILLMDALNIEMCCVLNFFFGVCICAHMHASPECLVPVKSRRELIPWTWRYRIF